MSSRFYCFFAIFFIVVTGNPISAFGHVLKVIQKDDIQRIEDYFNQIITIHSDFLQINSAGLISRGVMWIERPGKMRFEYAPPSSVLLTSDGIWLTYQDNELKQTTQIPLISSPFSVLLSKYISFTDDLVVQTLNKSCEMLLVQLYQRDDPTQGKIILAFQDNPLSLTQWSIIDNNGSEVKVVLLNPVFDLKFPSKLWRPKDFGQKFGALER
ncbi:outer membrane lipocarrier LolA family protein [Candidatus Endolissoclinum faulkneri L2]|uniref:Outer membrane lipocarrier LolA family protein n=1 Tax=Candidatus Endolissoclinum faulkneri L2 TaxID=1193729 RepID=K7Z2R3_9PROT|nr:outer membrane lipoprotein carrier protein LolA [Candidatus Endolissoclinum faulkneri]AFX98263.1 outer membrane lipocarrier LolA family protein [Candidatus Endolissoclinum faulkneri L2]